MGTLLGALLAALALLVGQDAEKVHVFTRPTPARQDAPFPMFRSHLESILNVAHSENKLSWHLGVGG